MRFENAQHFLHIDSYVGVTAIQYGGKRTTDSIVCYANSDACPYSGFVREDYSRTVRRKAYVFGRPMVAPTDGNKISRVAVV